MILAASTVNNGALWAGEVIGFAILAWLVMGKKYQKLDGKTIRQLVGDMLAARAGRIDAQLRVAEENRIQAEQARAEAKADIAQAHEEAGKMLERSKGMTASLAADMRTSAEAEKNRIVAQARDEIDAERNRAILDLRTKAADAAVDAAREVLTRTMDDATDRSLIKRALGHEEFAPGAGGPA